MSSSIRAGRDAEEATVPNEDHEDLKSGAGKRTACIYCGVGEGYKHLPNCPIVTGSLGEGVTNSIDKPPLQIVTPIPPEVEQYAPEIARFVEAMVYKLGVHHKKGKWEGIDKFKTMELLAGEVKELESAIQRGNMVEQLLEAADVANYALIISAKAMEK